jgi:hypothetical protein
MNKSLKVYDQISDMTSIEALGTAICRSGMFGCQSIEQGTIFALQCITERKPPLELAKTYHIISGKLSKRSDAILADFRRAGGTFKWEDLKNNYVQKATVEFEGQTFHVEFDMEQAKHAKLLKAGSQWEKSPAAMLRARLISETVRAIAPELIQGSYVPEELESERPEIYDVELDEQETVPAIEAELVEDIGTEEPEKKKIEVNEPDDEVPMDDGEPVEFEKVEKINKAWKALKKSDEAIVPALRWTGNEKATGFGGLTKQQAGKLLAMLQVQMNKLAETQSTAKENSDLGETTEPGLKVDDSVAAWLDENAKTVNDYLGEIGWIKSGRQWRNLDQDKLDMISKRTDSFAKNAGIEPPKK